MDSLNVENRDALLLSEWQPYTATFVDFPEPKGCNNHAGDQSLLLTQYHRLIDPSSSKFQARTSYLHKNVYKSMAKAQHPPIQKKS